MLPKGREMLDAQHVQEKYDIAHPSVMRDLQALMGDAAVRIQYSVYDNYVVYHVN